MSLMQVLLFDYRKLDSERVTQVFCVFLFLAAMALLGAIVSEITDIVASATRSSKPLEERLEAYGSVKPRSSVYTLRGLD